MSPRPLTWRPVASGSSEVTPRLAFTGGTTADLLAGTDRRPEGAGDDRPRHVRVRLETAARPASARRRAVAEQCRGRVPAELVDDLRVIASELVANVVQHGGGSDGLTLDVTIRDSEVDVQVVGRGDRRALPPCEEWSIPAASERSGRGLAIVRQLAAWVAIDGDDPVDDREGWIGITASVPVHGAVDRPITAERRLPAGD